MGERMSFESGTKVQVKHDKTHSGKVIHQTDDRVLWECKCCDGVSDDFAKDLEKVKS